MLRGFFSGFATLIGVGTRELRDDVPWVDVAVSSVATSSSNSTVRSYS